MKIALGGILATGMLAACGPPQLFVIPDNPYSNSDSAVVPSGTLTLIASRNAWYEGALSQVSTPVEVVLVNRGQVPIPVSLDELTLVDERGRIYHALPSEAVVTSLFGETPPPPPEQEPVAPSPGPSEGAPPAEPSAPSKPPPTDLQSPPPEKPSETFEPSLLPGIVLVAGHGGGGGGGHGSVGHAAGGHFVGHGYSGHGYNGWGGRSGYRYGRGYPGRFGAWGWGAPYWGYGAWGWWFGPSYVLGLNEAPYDYYPYDPGEFDELGPWQVYEVAMRPTELGPNERMGGLVFFEPAWDATVLTLHFVAHPKGAAPVQLSARFEVSR